MRKILIYSLIAFLAVLYASCNFLGSNPDEIFAKVGLNANKIPRSFKRSFDEIRAHHKQGSLTIITKDNEVKNGVSATKYI
ncbi:hypothetical protein [Sphingobacterium wenxiniae]|uniref:Uncharacterized protein n=1 Tax=Sphingobacterium wenxiniae TaxID=683125 RepID=A0A1I6P3Z1_9SPHI|nr:hypothetical protein [Sphingobacterium wenxiniae]SFS34810.1 hypothetical protein SAMN05660206_101266 [Sphingobacterium wenxiniae]